MKALRWGMIAAVLGAWLFASSVAADIVVLSSGLRVAGEVLVLRDSVRVRNQDGVFSVALFRVREIIRAGGEHGGAPQPVALQWEAAAPAVNEVPARAAESTEAAQRANPLAAGNTPYPTSSCGFKPLLALATLISVDFHETPLVDAISYIQEVTRGNFAYSPADLRTDPTPVNLRLNYVPLEHVLNLLLEGRGLQWEVARDVILIRPETAAGRLELRRYDVRDLIINTEDKDSAGRQGFRGPSLRYESDVTNPQYRPIDESSYDWWQGRELSLIHISEPTRPY